MKNLTVMSAPTKWTADPAESTTHRVFNTLRPILYHYGTPLGAKSIGKRRTQSIFCRFNMYQKSTYLHAPKNLAINKKTRLHLRLQPNFTPDKVKSTYSNLQLTLKHYGTQLGIKSIGKRRMQSIFRWFNMKQESTFLCGSTSGWLINIFKTRV